MRYRGVKESKDTKRKGKERTGTTGPWIVEVVVSKKQKSETRRATIAKSKFRAALKIKSETETRRETIYALTNTTNCQDTRIRGYEDTWIRGYEG